MVKFHFEYDPLTYDNLAEIYTYYLLWLDSPKIKDVFKKYPELKEFRAKIVSRFAYFKALSPDKLNSLITLCILESTTKIKGLAKPRVKKDIEINKTYHEEYINDFYGKDEPTDLDLWLEEYKAKYHRKDNYFNYED